MKWGHYYEGETPHQQLLIWVLECVLFPDGGPLDQSLKRILAPSGGMGGDPGWFVDQIASPNNEVSYKVWADPDISGIEPHEDTYSETEMLTVLRDSLVALSEAHPETRAEVDELLKRYCMPA